MNIPSKSFTPILNLALVAVMTLSITSASVLAEEKPTQYLFTYFTGNGEDGLHLAWSSDGYKWEALNSGKSYLRPEVGESKLMRDPCVLRGPEGTFHLVWTTAWNGKTIGYASSKDLILWSPQKAVPVMGHEPDVRSRDLKTWEDVTQQMTFVPGMRHGTVIAVTADAVARLRRESPAQ